MTELADPIPESTRIVKKKEFIERVVTRANIKKADARAAIDAALSTLSDALLEGEELILPPLGRVKINRIKDGRSGKQLILKLSLPKNEENASQGLADTADTD